MLPAPIAGVDAIFAVRIEVIEGSADVAATKLCGHDLKIAPGPSS